MNDTIEKLGNFAIRVKIATSTSRSTEIRKNFEENSVIYDVCAILLVIASGLVAEIGWPVPKYS